MIYTTYKINESYYSKGLTVMLNVFHVGYKNIETRDSHFVLDDKQTYWFIINMLTPFEMFCSNEWKRFDKNRIIIFPPYTPVEYRACPGETIENNWIMFETTESFIINFSLPFATPIHTVYQTAFDYIFHLISIENFWENIYKAQSMNHLFHFLFDKIYESYYSYNQIPSTSIIKLHLEIEANPNYPWTIEEMANRLNMSVSYFQSIYKKNFGISCMKDILIKRIELAKNYLKNSGYSISQIADLCGYQNKEHFCRQFKQFTTITASQYRKNYITMKSRKQ